MVSSKQIRLSASRFVLRFALFTSIGLLAVWLVFLRSADFVKQSLEDNDAYYTFVQGVIEENKGQQGGIPLDDPRVERIAHDIFNPPLLQTEAEKFIDASYNWLNGQTTTIIYSLDVSEIRTTLANKFADYAVNRLEFLPACTDGFELFDPITTNCNNKYIDDYQVREAARSAILQSSILPKENTINADNLPKNELGQSFVQQYSYAPILFQSAPLLLCLLVILTLASAVYVVRLRNKRRGWREVGSTLVTTCIGLAIFTYIFVFLLPDQLANRSGQLEGNGANKIQLLTQSISNDLIRKTQGTIINISIQVAAIGGVILIIEKFSRPVSTYSGVRRKSGLTSSISPKKSLQLGHGKYDDVPVVSSEGAKRKHLPRKRKKPSKARKIAKGLE